MKANLHSLPTLDELALDPARTAELSTAAKRALAWKALAVLSALQLAGTAEVLDGGIGARSESERLIDAGEVAVMIGFSKSWVEKHSAELPPRRSVAGNPRWLRSDVEKWIRNRPKYGSP